MVEPAPEDCEYELVVVDEAHHIYRDARFRKRVEDFIGDKTRLWLLSDISQSRDKGIEYPSDDMIEVLLEEVVRCTKRIIAGALAFQLGDKRGTTRCHNDMSSGAPLKSYIYPRPAREEERMAQYASHVVQALQDLRAHFKGTLPMSNRIGIVVPDEKFREELERELAALEAFQSLRFIENTRPALVRAKETCAMLMEGSAHDAEEQLIVLDTVAEFDGPVCRADSGRGGGAARRLPAKARSSLKSHAGRAAAQARGRVARVLRAECLRLLVTAQARTHVRHRRWAGCSHLARQRRGLCDLTCGRRQVSRIVCPCFQAPLLLCRRFSLHAGRRAGRTVAVVPSDDEGADDGHDRQREPQGRLAWMRSAAQHTAVPVHLFARARSRDFG